MKGDTRSLDSSSYPILGSRMKAVGGRGEGEEGGDGREVGIRLNP